MKYVIDIPNQNLAGAQANLSVAGYHFNFTLKPLCEPKKPGLVYFRTPQHRESWMGLHFGGIPLVTEPAFEFAPDPSAFYVGDTWETVGGDRVRIIARHSDGEFEVSVVHRAQNFDPRDERRGTRVGSSFIVTKFGKVKQGHLAPPSSLSLCRKVASLASDYAYEVKPNRPVGKSASITIMDDVVDPATAWTRTAIQKEIHAATRAFVSREELDRAMDNMQGVLLVALRGEIQAEIKKGLAYDHERATKVVNGLIDEKLKAYDAAKVKLFVGKTYVTRNGSQVEVEQIAATDGHTTGRITRGGTSKHGFKVTVGFRKDGKFAGDFRSSRFDDARWDLEHPLDIMYEVINVAH